MTLNELKEDLTEFFKQKGIGVYKIEAQIQFGMDFVHEIQVQMEGVIAEEVKER